MGTFEHSLGLKFSWELPMIPPWMTGAVTLRPVHWARMFFLRFSLSSRLSVGYGRGTSEWMQLPIDRSTRLSPFTDDPLIALEMSLLTFDSGSENFTPL